MSATSEPNNTSKRWIKISLIPVLLGVLALVLWPGSNSQNVELALDPAEILAEENSPVTPVSSTSNSEKSVWRKADIQDVIAFNPFEAYSPKESQSAGDGETNGSGLPSAEHPDDSRSQEAAVGTLQALFVDSQGAAAILDSQVIRVGDTLPSGARVIEITAEGVKVEGL